MSGEAHALGRAVRRMSVDGAVALERRRAMLGFDQLQEIEYQYQIPISGTVDDRIFWRTVDLEFDVEFFHAPEQRDSPLTMPHFTFGAVVSGESVATTNEHGAVVVTAVVSGWTTDDRDAVIGAQLSVGVTAPDGECEYQGYVHLSFQGFAAPAEALDVG